MKCLNFLIKKIIIKNKKMIKCLILQQTADIRVINRCTNTQTKLLCLLPRINLISVWNGTLFEKMYQLLEGYQLLAEHCTFYLTVLCNNFANRLESVKICWRAVIFVFILIPLFCVDKYKFKVIIIQCKSPFIIYY